MFGCRTGEGVGDLVPERVEDDLGRGWTADEEASFAVLDRLPVVDGADDAPLRQGHL